MEGFESKDLEKIGLKPGYSRAFFNNVKVPKENLLGEEEGFKYMMENLPQERLVLAISAIGIIEEILGTQSSTVRRGRLLGNRLVLFKTRVLN